MRGRSLLQLITPQDNILIETDITKLGNPNINFYKSVYRKHVNFSLESDEIILSTTTINEDSNVSIPNIIIPSNRADFLLNLYLSFTLPNIYSGSYNADSDESSDINNIPYEFRWVENIGTNLIDDAKLIVGGEQLNKITGKLMQVLSEVKYDDSKKNIYNEMVGNVPEIYYPRRQQVNKDKTFLPVLTDIGSGYSATYASDSPSYVDNLDDTDDTQFSITVDGTNVNTVKIEKNGYNLRNDYRTFLKQGSEKDAQVLILESDYPHLLAANGNQNQIYNKNTDITITKNSDVGNSLRSNFVPSIKKKKCKVPLPFYFSENIGSSLPLCCLENSPVEIELNLNPIKNLYTVLKLHGADSNLQGDTSIYGDSGSHTITDPTRKVFRTKPPSTLSIGTFLETQNLELGLRLEAQYMYIDSEERKRFMQNTQSYLIEEYFEYNYLNAVTGNTNQNYYLNNPVKELIIVSQRTDMKYINNWNNYSNWIIEDVAPYSEQYNVSEHMYYSDSISYLSYNKYDSNTTDSTKQFQMKYFDKHIIEKIKFKYDSVDTRNVKDSEYFNLVQPFQHLQRKIKNGIYVYSFGLEPNKFQANGHLNFSKINKFNLAIDIAPDSVVKIPSKNNQKCYKYDIALYTISYNILTIKSGFCVKEFL